MSFVYVCVCICVCLFQDIYCFKMKMFKTSLVKTSKFRYRNFFLLSVRMYRCVCVSVCSVRACVLHRHIDIYIIERSRQSLGVNVDVALPSVGSVVPWNMTHAITGRRGTLYQLLAIATTRGGTRCEIQRVPPHIHTASNNINRSNRDSLTKCWLLNHRF